MRIDFYHLERISLDKALPLILEKAIKSGQKILIKTEMAERAEYINTLLWTYDPGSFLPHGIEKEGYVEQQPIFITAKADYNPNLASLLIIVDNEDVPETSSFERILYFFNGRDETALDKARKEWKRLKSSNAALYYWKQDPTGRWEQKL